MHLLFALVAQLAQGPYESLPLLEFPEPGVDDTAAYQGYRTRFFRDARRNTLQIYIDGKNARVVHLLADANNESIGFSVRGPAGRPVPVTWAGAGASVAIAGRYRVFEHRLTAEAPHVAAGLFLLGSMRVERDFQYSGRHTGALNQSRFRLPEFERFFAALSSLSPPERGRHLAVVRAPTMTQLRARLDPTIANRTSGRIWIARVVQPSFDGLDTLALEIRVDTTVVEPTRSGEMVSLRARSGDRVPFTVRLLTTTSPITPLSRDEIFSADFLRFLAQARAGDPARARWLERQVRGVELLSSHEKLMAGLPAYATYFGRDMLLSALMMRPIWRDEMSEFVIASVLRKLSPSGQVSHEEALGGQAVREAAAEYADLVRAGRIDRARAVLENHRQVRENYHMVDDEFQLPILAARWLADPEVANGRKREFLLDSSDGGGARVVRLLRELALVARMSAPYAANPTVQNLISFPARDTGWSSASWRDSGAGYAGGRYAMDINAIYTPHALEAMTQILAAIRAAGISPDSILSATPDLGANDSPLARYVRDPATLRAAADAWWSAARHFVVRLSPAEIQTRVGQRLAAMPAPERAYWTGVLASTRADQDSVEFMALSLDGSGQPIAVANSDPATGLFLGGGPHQQPGDVLRDVRLFVRNYPVGLFVDRVGPVVANDAFASPAVWQRFVADHYHGPRVAWGREVNLFLLGAADRVANSRDEAFNRELRDAIDKVRAAVAASGFRSELWSYEIREGELVPVRYATGSDVQLWSTTDLAVQYVLSRLER